MTLRIVRVCLQIIPSVCGPEMRGERIPPTLSSSHPGALLSRALRLPPCSALTTAVHYQEQD